MSQQSRRSISGDSDSGSHRGSGSGSRVYGPSEVEFDLRLFRPPEKVASVLAKIRHGYSQVKIVKGSSDLCIGLLDPISNINVNRATYVLSEWVSPGGGQEQAEAGDQIQLSLEGLIAFLTTLFPYLPDCEALRCLDAANADPLVAALFVISSRGMQAFHHCSKITMAAVETSLRCAAVAAKHRDPVRFVGLWKGLSPDLVHFVSDCSSSQDGHYAMLLGALQVLRPPTEPGQDFPLHLDGAWLLAFRRMDFLTGPPSRRRHVEPEPVPPSRLPMKRLLLERIHAFYLRALALLPTAELRTRYHHSLLNGGYCYGLLDPVCNIIVNTIWYDQAFPMTKEVTLDMISTESLWRVAARSLYGMLSFLCTCYPSYTPDEAMKKLLLADADLRFADPYLMDGDTPALVSPAQQGTWKAPSVSAIEAYAAAATAAFHPAPAEQQQLLGLPKSVNWLQVATDVMRLPVGGRVLSAEDLSKLPMFVNYAPSLGRSRQLKDPIKMSESYYAQVCGCRDRFWDQHERVTSMVAAALDRYNQIEGTHFRLHIICGVNELVSVPRSRPGGTRFQYHHSHINFLATTSQDSISAGEPATLFFAECSNHGISEECWCAPMLRRPDAVMSGQARCLYCEREGNRIVHPAEKAFYGRDKEFEMVLRAEQAVDGPSKDCYNNRSLILHKLAFVDWVGGLEDDCIYSNDSDFVVDKDEEAPSMKDLIRRIRVF